MYGDFDPADAYDASDPPPERLRVLERVVAVLEQAADDPPRRARRDDAARVAVNLSRTRGVDTRRVAAVLARLAVL